MWVLSLKSFLFWCSQIYLSFLLVHLDFIVKVHSKNYKDIPRSQENSFMFYCSTCIVLFFTFKSLIHLDSWNKYHVVTMHNPFYVTGFSSLRIFAFIRLAFKSALSDIDCSHSSSLTVSMIYFFHLICVFESKVALL